MYAISSHHTAHFFTLFIMKMNVQACIQKDITKPSSIIWDFPNNPKLNKNTKSKKKLSESHFTKSISHSQWNSTHDKKKTFYRNIIYEYTRFYTCTTYSYSSMCTATATFNLAKKSFCWPNQTKALYSTKTLFYLLLLFHFIHFCVKSFQKRHTWKKSVSLVLSFFF